MSRPSLSASAFDTGRSLPDGLTEADVRAAIERRLQRESLARPRRDPIRLPEPHLFVADLVFVAGGRRDDRPVAVWRYAQSASRDPAVAPPRSDLRDRHLVVAAVGARGGVYHAHYPPEVGPVRNADEASRLAEEDGALHGERERILDGYRQRREAKPKRWQPHFELAMVSAGCEVDLPPLPGARSEAIAAARDAARRAAKQAKVQAVLGWLLEREAAFGEATDAYGRAAALAKKNVLFAWAWADNLAFAGRTEEARSAFEEAQRRDRSARGPTFDPGRHRRTAVDRLDTWIIDQAHRVRTSQEDLANGVSDAQAQGFLAIDPTQVPAPFRDLVPLVETWAVGDDAELSALVARATRGDKKAILAALDGRRRAVNDWLDTFDENNLTNEAAAFMTFLLACEEMDI